MRYENNPLNIRMPKTEFFGTLGYDNGFVRFASVAHCIRAAILILRSYRSRSIFTISDIIETWAPPHENSTSAYITYVCDKMSVHRGYEIDVLCPLVLYTFLSALCHYESGYALSVRTFDEAYKMFAVSRKELFQC